MKTKDEFSKEVWERVKAVLELRKISQVQLKDLCQQHNFSISQPEISKLYTGKVSLNLYQLAAFSSVLKIPIDQFVNPGGDPAFFRIMDSVFITSPQSEAFNGYLGRFYVLFHSTSPFDKKILHGKIEFGSSENQEFCRAVFELDTGDHDMKGSRIVKKYQGQLLISDKMGVAYCILLNRRIGEICMMEFRYRSFFVRRVECRMGLSLSVASGETKTPVVQKVFLSREEIIDEEIVKEFAPCLKLESEEFLISKESFQSLAEKEKIPGFDFEALMKELELEEYIRVDENMIRRVDKRIDRRTLVHILAVLKRYSEGKYLVNLSEKDDSQAYEMVCGLGQEATG